MRWTDGPPGKVAAAVRAYACQDPIGALGTERTLEGANDCLRVRWQILVAAFTVRAELKHVQVPVLTTLLRACELGASSNLIISLSAAARGTVTNVRARRKARGWTLPILIQPSSDYTTDK